MAPRILLIGHGYLGKFHLEKLITLENEGHLKCSGVVESQQSQRELIKSQYPHLNLYEDTYDSSLLESTDGVIIASPTFTHFELIKYCLDHGLHIFCEKPLVKNRDEAFALEKLIEKKEKKSLVLQVGHSERFHQSHSFVLEYLKDLKKEACTHLSFLREGPFTGRATDVSVVNDLMIHDIDLLFYFFPDENFEVLRATGIKGPTNKWDRVEAHLQSEKVSAKIVGSRMSVRQNRKCEIISSRGHLLSDFMEEKIEFTLNNFLKTEVKTFEKRDHLYGEQFNFVESIKQNKQAIVSFEEGLKAVKMVEDIHKVLES